MPKKSQSELIVAYLETFNQPQSARAVYEHALESPADMSMGTLQDELDRLAQDGKIYRVEDGVDAGGTPMVWYGPVAS